MVNARYLASNLQQCFQRLDLFLRGQEERIEDRLCGEQQTVDAGSLDILLLLSFCCAR
jgi:hypothetical protein